MFRTRNTRISQMPRVVKLFRESKPRRHRRTAGVPQGGVLSGMLANLYLNAFDEWVLHTLNEEIPLRYFRYADDLVALTQTEEEAHQAFEKIERKLANKFKLTVHPIGTKSQIRNIKTGGIEFVGFQITHKHIRVRPQNIVKFQKHFEWSIGRIKKHGTSDQEKRLEELIRYYLNSIIHGPPDNCQNCGKANRRYNWMSFFAPVITDLRQIRKLDGWIRKTVNRYMFEQYGTRIRNKRHLQSKELGSLMQEYNRCKGLRFCRCDDDCPDKDRVEIPDAIEGQ